MQTLKRIFWLVFFIFILSGTGYGLYWYFTNYSSLPMVNQIINQEDKVRKEYLDTLVVDINNNLKEITTGVSIMSGNFQKAVLVITVMSFILFINFIVTVILCFFVISLRAQKKNRLE